MTNSYLVVQVKGDRNDGRDACHDPDYGYYAYVLKTNEKTNLVAQLDDIVGLVSATICPTKKRAEELAEFWNTCFRRNGTYLFDEPKF